MPKLKSLITRTEVDTAKKAHGCRSNHRHRIESGDIRLKVRNGRSWQHYCLECAKAILRSDFKKLEILADRFETNHAAVAAAFDAADLKKTNGAFKVAEGA